MHIRQSNWEPCSLGPTPYYSLPDKWMSQFDWRQSTSSFCNNENRKISAQKRALRSQKREQMTQDQTKRSTDAGESINFEWNIPLGGWFHLQNALLVPSVVISPGLPQRTCILSKVNIPVDEIQADHVSTIKLSSNGFLPHQDLTFCDAGGGL